MKEELEELRALLAQKSSNLTSLGEARLSELIREYAERPFIDNGEYR